MAQARTSTKLQSYAGISLGINTPQLQGWSDELLPYVEFNESDFWWYQGYTPDTASLPFPVLPQIPRLQPGVLYWPTGASRPAFYHQVVSQTQLDLIRTAVACLTQAYPLVLADGRSGKSITAQMYLLPARPLSQLGINSDAWLLTLTDQRFYWYWRTGSISTTPSSWTGLYAQISSLLGVTITPDTVPSAYQTPSSKWKGYLRPLPSLLDAVANQIGQRVVVGLDGTVKTVNWQTAQAASQTQLEDVHLAAGGTIDDTDIARYVPRAMSVAFADWSSGTLAKAPVLSTQYLGLLGIEDYAAQSCSGVDATGLLYADYSYNAVNATGTVPAYAQQITTDWYGWRLSDTEITIPGIEPWIPTGWEDAVEWIAQLRDTGPAIMTRIRRGAWSWLPSGTFTGDNPTGPQPPNPLTPTDCAAILGLLNRSSCFTLTLPSNLGDCSCVDTSQTSNLTRDSSGALVGDTLLYGCPPGVVTSLFPGGAPKKFTATLAGFTGCNSTYNGAVTFTYTTGNTWTATAAGGATFTLTASGSVGNVTWTLTVSDDGAFSYSVSSISNGCASITLTKVDDGACSGSPSTITLTPTTGCGLGTPYTAILDACNDSCGRPEPRLRWVPQTGSGLATITWSNVGCGTDANGNPAIEFTTDNPLLCAGTPAADCAPNYLKARATCRSCSICTCASGVSFSGAGWYCQNGVGCVYFASDPGPSVKLCYGPFPNQTDCQNPLAYQCSCSPITAPPGYICVSFAYIPGDDPDCFGLDGKKFLLPLAGLFPPDPSGGDNRVLWAVQTALPNDCPVGVLSTSPVCISVSNTTASGLCPPNLSGYAGSCGLNLQLRWNLPNALTIGVTLSPSSGMLSAVCSLLAGISLTGTTGTAYTCDSGRHPCGSGSTSPNYTVTVTPSDASGTGCQPNVPAISYNCNEGTCTDPGDGSGVFTGPNALTNCQAACGTSPPPATCDCSSLIGLTGSVVIPSGPAAGTYTGTWVSDEADGCVLTITFPGGGLTVSGGPSPPFGVVAGYLGVDCNAGATSDDSSGVCVMSVGFLSCLGSTATVVT